MVNTTEILRTSAKTRKQTTPEVEAAQQDKLPQRSRPTPEAEVEAAYIKKGLTRVRQPNDIKVMGSYYCSE